MTNDECPTGVRRKVSAVVPALLDWFGVNARDLPWRRTRDPYAIWASEIMLQQTQVKTVIPYFERWMRTLPTIQSLAEAPEEQIHKLWEGLGYYSRVRNMQRAARVIVERHGTVFPQAFDEVLALPGIGRYTAGAVCSIAFNQAAPILDGNVIRVLTRLFGIRENARERETNGRLWKLAEEFVAAAARESREPKACSALNQSLMELGATVCTPRAPQCQACPLRRRCVARREGCVDSLPNLGVRAASQARRFVAAVIERDGRVLVRQRPAGVVNARLWEFPNVEITASADGAAMIAALERELGCELAALEPLCTIRHSITRYRITLEAFRGGVNGARLRMDAGEWRSPREIAQLPFTSAHRRVATGCDWR